MTIALPKQHLVMLVVIFVVADNNKEEEEKRQNNNFGLTINFGAFGVWITILHLKPMSNYNLGIYRA